MKSRRWAVCAAAAAGLLAGTARAEFVTVGNPGNAGDTRYPDSWWNGSVGYVYRISRFEVTAGEWRAFLNAVDPTGANALGLYNASLMDTEGGCQITWNTNLLTYDFSGRPSGDESDWVDRPVGGVSWHDAARYCNWLTTGNTETGVYNTSTWTALPHETAVRMLKVQAACFLPTADEWYKAAYYDGTSATYFDYPTGTNTAPTSEPPPGGANSANCWVSGNGAIGPPYYRTNVGAYSSADSPYGTFDQGGNVWEWNETLVAGLYRVVRGGSMNDYPVAQRCDYVVLQLPTTEYGSYGFRVAQVPAVGTVISVR